MRSSSWIRRRLTIKLRVHSICGFSRQKRIWKMRFRTSERPSSPKLSLVRVGVKRLKKESSSTLYYRWYEHNEKASLICSYYDWNRKDISSDESKFVEYAGGAKYRCFSIGYLIHESVWGVQQAPLDQILFAIDSRLAYWSSIFIVASSLVTLLICG